MSSDVPFTVAQAAEALRGGTISSVRLTEALLARIAAGNERLGAFVAVTGESALKAAEMADADFAAGTVLLGKSTTSEFALGLAAVGEEVRAAVGVALERIAEAGARVEEMVVPHAEEAKDANHVTLVAEAYAYHRGNLVHRWGDYGRYTRRTLARGALLTSADYAQAQRFRSYFRRMVAGLLVRYDVLVTPTWPTPAPRGDELSPEQQLLGVNFTGPWNLAGLPAAAVPCGFSSSGLPLSMQVIGQPFAEARVLQVADAYQGLTDWHLRVPPEPGAAVRGAAR